MRMDLYFDAGCTDAAIMIFALPPARQAPVAGCACKELLGARLVQLWGQGFPCPKD